MYGPLRVERDISSLALTLSLARSPADDHQSGLLVAPRTVAERRLAPRGLRTPAGTRAALAASVRMVERVHRRATYGRALSAPAALARLADVLVLVLDVADLANRGVARDRDPSHLTGWHPDLGIVVLASQQLGRHPGGPNHLGAATRLELDVVHRGAQRN